MEGVPGVERKENVKDKNLVSLKDVNSVLKKKKATEINPYIWRVFGLPVPEKEFRFHPKRRWRFDYAFPETKLAIEIEGGVYANGRHTRGKGYEKDCEKYNSAISLGWRVLRYLPGKVDYKQVQEVFEQ